MEQRQQNSNQQPQQQRPLGQIRSGYLPQNQLVSKQSTLKIRHSDNSLVQQDLSPYPEMITPINKQKSMSIRDHFSQSKLDDAVSSQLKSHAHIDYPYETDSNYNTNNPMIRSKDGSSGNWREERNSDRFSHAKQQSQGRSRRLNNDRSNQLIEQHKHHSSSYLLDSVSQQHRQKNPVSPSPRTISHAHNTAAALTRTHAIFKFQSAVQRAIQSRRDLIEAEGGNIQRQGQNVPGESIVKKKTFTSLFDVVMKMNPFGFKRRRDTRILPGLSNIKSGTNSERAMLVEDQEQIDKILQEQRRQRARQLWRKAKAVLRAIMTWKAIQSEIQLYGTHNYEFRRNFKMTRSGHSMKGQVHPKESQIKDKKTWHYSIHPDSKFKKLWSVIMVILLLYVATIMPFNIAFVDLDDAPIWFVVDTIIDFVFMADVFINFFSAYYDDDGILVTENKKIVKKYLKTWFVIDLIASFPINLIQRSVLEKASQNGNYNQILRLLRLPRLYRLLKIARLVKIISFVKRNPFIQKLQDFMAINAGIMKLMQFLITGLVCIHLAACLWFYSAILSNDYPNTWVVKNGFQDSSMGRQYIASLYWSIQTILTVGYGDITPGTNTERVVCILWMVIGVGFYSFTIGTLTSILSRIDTRSSQLKDKVEVIEIFCSEAKINQQLKKKIKDVLEYNSIRNAFSWIEKYSIFNELPPNLKCEVAMQIHDGAIGKLPFFTGKDQTFIGNIVPLLQPLRVQEYDYIYMQDDHPYELYFIVLGRVNFVIDIGECVFKQWPQGSYFGEIEIIKQKKRLCTAKAAIDCDLFTLNKKYYQTIIQNDYPEVAKKLKDIAYEREIKVEEGLKKSFQVLENVGIHDGALPLSKLNRMGSLASASSNKQYFNAFNKAQARSNFRKYSASQRSMLSKPSQDNLIQPQNEQNKSQSEDSDESSNYNIWGEKEKESSSEDGKKDSFHTDKSMKGKNFNGSEKGSDNLSGAKPKLRQRSSFSMLYVPGKSPLDNQLNQLDLVKESSLESGSLRKSKKREMEDDGTFVEEEFKLEDHEESSIPKIQIMPELSIMNQNTDNSNQQHLDVIPQNFHDSHFFSQHPHDESHSQNIFKKDDTHGNHRQMHYLDTDTQNTQIYAGMHYDIEAPKIMINDKTYSYSQMDTTSHRHAQSNKNEWNTHNLFNSTPLAQLEVVSSVCQMEIICVPKTPPTLPFIKLPINDINSEVVTLKDQVKDIQKGMQNNKFQQTTIQEKITQVTTSLELISKVIKDISLKQVEQQRQINDQEVRLMKQEQQQQRMQQNQAPQASNFRPRTLVYHLQAQRPPQAQRLNNQTQSSFVPYSFSLNSNNSLVPVTRERNFDQQLDNSNEMLRIPITQDQLRGHRTGRDFSYTEDLENLQREYNDAQEITHYSLPDV